MVSRGKRKEAWLAAAGVVPVAPPLQDVGRLDVLRRIGGRGCVAEENAGKACIAEQIAGNAQAAGRISARQAAGAVLLALALLGGLLAGGMGVQLAFQQKAASIPSCGLEVTDRFSPEQGEDGFPLVDWDFWQGVNPDVVGWVSIPGTELSCPVVRASSDDPEFYLHHDVFRQQSVYGCPYRDAECEEEGFASWNCVIYGHNMSDGTQFAPFVSYTAEGFAEGHRLVLLQTPTEKMRLQVLFAGRSEGLSDSKKLAFAGKEDYSQWFNARKNEAEVLLEDADPERVFTFVTCSDDTSVDERVLVFAHRIPDA